MALVWGEYLWGRRALPIGEVSFMFFPGLPSQYFYSGGDHWYPLAPMYAFAFSG
jgi:hypothetical protein